MGLPDFLADGRPPIGLFMQIGRSNAGEKLVKIVRGSNGRNDDKTSLFDRNLNLSVLLKTDLVSKSFGDSNRQAVAPFLNPCSH